MSLETSAEAPVPVRTVLQLVGGWIGRLGRVWVEGQIAECAVITPDYLAFFNTLAGGPGRRHVSCLSACVQPWRTLFPGPSVPANGAAQQECYM